jgi:uncharacterized membrane protein SpoIIM required for sporulation
MKETRFIEQNQEKWKELEDLLKADQRDSDKLSDLFIQVTDDLSYARTHYPRRVVRVYLNQLTQSVFGQLYRKTSSQRNQFFTFWKTDLPLSLYYGRKALLFSFLLFALSFLIGVISSIYDPEFAASILSEVYIAETERNIAENDPMAIYKDEYAIEMFFRIAVNNLSIAFRTFLSGLIFGIGTVGTLVFNGIMVGVFQYFFIARGLFVDSALTIWMHGTFEISAIVIAGGAGLMLGKALVFPGTFTRLQSLRIAARSGIRVILLVGLMLFVAAIIETFVTRYTSLDNWIRFGLIIAMFALVVFYVVIYPRWVFKKGVQSNSDQQYLPVEKPFQPMLEDVKSSSELFGTTFSAYFKILGKLSRWVIPAAFGLMLLYLNNNLKLVYWADILYAKFFSDKVVHFHLNDHLFLLPVFAILISLTGYFTSRFWLKLVTPKPKRTWTQTFGKIFTVFLVILPINLLLLLDGWGLFLYILVFPIISLICVSVFISDESPGQAVSEAFGLLGSGFSQLAGLALSILILSVLILLLGDAMPSLINLDILEIFMEIDNLTYVAYQAGVVLFFFFASLLMVFALLFMSSIMLYYSLREQNLALGLQSKLQKVGLLDEK